MSDSKKKRLSMLDSLTAAGAPAPQPIMAASRPLRAARDAVDSHKVWDVDPDQIVDTRLADRLDPADVADLRQSIEASGQTVPILLRRDPKDPEKYLLVYGRRRLEAIRSSDKIDKVRALIAHLDDDSAVEAQISENTARRDLSYIEKALFARELISSGFGNQTRVAEVLTATKSAISMALGIVDAVGEEVIRAIGPAHGIGRPRWEALAKKLQEWPGNKGELVAVATQRRSRKAGVGDPETSTAAFDAVLKAVMKDTKSLNGYTETENEQRRPQLSKIKRTARGISLEVAKGPFADWIEAQGAELIDELHARWQQHTKDNEQP